jgi:predicted DNA-binding transcriptional regulator AlpA
MLGIPPSKIPVLKLIKDQPLPRPKKAGPAELFAWFFDAIEILVAAKTGRER